MKKILLVLLFCFYAMNFLWSQRSTVALNNGWKFHFAYDVRKNASTQSVTLPHTWNGQDVLDGKMDYRRTQAIYERILVRQKSWRGKRVFLQFDGVNSNADVFINDKIVTSHKGGYTAFCTEITSFLTQDTSVLTVWVSNAARMDILPLTGDFNVYGGIHRPVRLIITDQNCIAPDYFGSAGIFVTTKKLTDAFADIDVVSRLHLQSYSGKYSLRTTVRDKKGLVVAVASQAVRGDSVVSMPLRIERPHLWNGIADPYLYDVEVAVLEGSKVLDLSHQPLGLRHIEIDASKGAFLNGKYYDLHGFGFHEDFAGVGSAMDTAQLRTDFGLIAESGATALRLTHYPHSQLMYNKADSSGILLWSEIPMVGPGGYTGYGYVRNPDLEAHAKNMLTEMILQNYNHPSVFCWGIFNELKLNTDDPISFLKELNRQAHSLDSQRYTVCASFIDSTYFNDVSDLIAWNKYYGWYGDQFSDIAKWADKAHLQMPEKPFAVSEYGAGGDPAFHQDSMTAPDPGGRSHFEEWQTLFHEDNWKYLSERPFVWGKFIWALTDFGSAIRTEGAHNAINDKGLVSYDRKIKKDAFYFYKANWNKSPVLYLTDRRFTDRKIGIIDVKVFSNLPTVTLYVNGEKVSREHPDRFKTIVWKHILLRKGENRIEVKGTSAEGSTLVDECLWHLN